MTNKRFIVETVEITDCDTEESRIAKVITDTNELYSYDDLYELCDDLNKLAEENEQLKYDNFMFKGVIETFQKVAISERKKLEKENEQLRKELQDRKIYCKMREMYE